MKETIERQKVNITDLPKYSHWPSRLLGLEKWKLKKRNIQLVKREYDEKWRTLYQYYIKDQGKDFDSTIMNIAFRSSDLSHNLFYDNGEIYYIKNDIEFWKFFYKKFFRILSRYLNPEITLVELGCGWGFNLFYAFAQGLCRKAIGGEYVTAGIKLGNLIAERFNLPIEFFYFDYYYPEKEFLNKLDQTVVFTCHSIEQLPFIPEETILAIAKSNPKFVVHLEPIYEFKNNSTLLHLLWKKYIEINDYNRNLLSVLKSLEKQGILKIIEEKFHVFGGNVFNPTSFIVWKPLT